MKIIPAIDILDGKCVRLTQGDYATQKIYNQNPLAVAREFEDHGITHVHVVDLDGAKSQKLVNYRALEAICSGTELSVDFGGGIKQDTDISSAFACGVNQVTVGSVAVTHPKRFVKWLEQYGADRIFLGADCKNREVLTSGWTQNGGKEIVEFVRAYEALGVQQVICTDVSADGMLQGPAVALYHELLEKSNVELIASGGVANITQVQELKALGCDGVIIGKAIYENKITLKELVALC